MARLKITVLLWPKPESAIKSIRHIAARIEDLDSNENFYFSFGASGGTEEDDNRMYGAAPSEKLELESTTDLTQLKRYWNQHYPNSFADFYREHQTEKPRDYPLNPDNFQNLSAAIVKLLKAKKPQLYETDKSLKLEVIRIFGLASDLNDIMTVQRFNLTRELYQEFTRKYQLTANNCAHAVSHLLQQAQVICFENGNANGTPAVLFNKLKIVRVDQDIKTLIQNPSQTLVGKMIAWLELEQQRLQHRIEVNQAKPLSFFKHLGNKQARQNLLMNFSDDLSANPDLDLQQRFAAFLSNYEKIGSSSPNEIPRLRTNFYNIQQSNSAALASQKSPNSTMLSQG